MKRNLVAKVLVVVFLFNLMLPVSVVQAYTLQKDDRFKEQIAEGVYLETIRQQTSDGPLNIAVVTVDLKNPYVQVDTVTNGNITGNQAVSQHAVNSGAVAVVNGDFFQINHFRAPIGMTVKSGEMWTSPAQRKDMYAFGITKDKLPVFDIWGFQGQVTAPNQKTFPLFGVNKPTYLADKGASPDLNRLNLYNPRWGANSRGSAAGIKGMVEMVVEDNVVKEIRVDQPGVAIPANGYVLAGHGEAAKFLQENFQVGSLVITDYKYTPAVDLQAAVGGQTLLVNYGKRSYFTQNIKGERARTAVGMSEDRSTLFLVTVEGGKTSRGMTQEELADFLVSIGVWQAMNLDGGGSTAMSARYLGDENNTLINVPQEGVERKVPNGIGIFTTAPRGSLVGLKTSGSDLMVVNMSRPFYAKGFDEHFNPYRVEPGQVTWAIEPALGAFNGNVLTASSGGDAVVTATVGGVSKSLPIKIIGREDIERLEISPAAINLNEGDSVDVAVKLIAKGGRTFNLAPGEVQWEAQGEIGSIQGNTFTAGSSRGVGSLVARVDGVEARAAVTVGSNESPFYGFENDMTLSFASVPAGAAGSFRRTVSGEPSFRGAVGARLDYNFTGNNATRVAYGRLGADGLALPGQPLGLGLWVLGDGGNGHWLRGRIVDAKGTEKLMDFAQKVDWQGWRKVKAKLPAGITYPVKLKEIYLAAPEGNGQNTGYIIMDELSLLVPVTADNLTGQPGSEVTGSAVTPTTGGTIKIGGFTFNLPAGTVSEAAYLESSQVWELNLPTPGYNPALPAVTIKGSGEKSGSLTKLSKAMGISVGLGEVAPERARLMWWNEETGAWQQVSARVEGDKLVGQTDLLGLFSLQSYVDSKASFPDLEGHWAKKEIYQLAEKGIVKGMAPNQFAPARKVTRAEFVTILARAFGWDSQGAKVNFKDQVPAWAQDAVAAAVARGIVKGYEDGTFQAQKVITRAEMAVIMDRVLNLPDSKQKLTFTDTKKIAAWAKPSVANAVAAGLLKGDQGKFRPVDTATRAEATVVVYRMLEFAAKK
ncbi:MAG: S-layer homology domain-containing protein [Clostridia bacterium]|nr:S-layer homology domain-containing protein [Clostridia bacterium]